MTNFYVTSMSPISGTQAYTNWVVAEKQEAEAMAGEDAHNTVDSCEALNVSLVDCWM